MSEHKLNSAQDPNEHDAYEWPIWEVQGHGTVTGSGDPRDGAARREVVPPWVDIRLTFADGARLDVLAVVRDGRIAIEGAQADPPLALDGFAALAEAIEAPLVNACQVVAGHHRPPAPQPAGDRPAGEPAAVEPAASEVTTREPAAGEPALGEPALGEPAERGPDAIEPAAAEAAVEPAVEPAVVEAATVEPAIVQPDAADVSESGPHADRGEEREPTGRHRGRPAVQRGGATRLSVAEIYRAAQQEGQDPVLAVMSATGFSRRKSLRLIAGARDEGHLSPRHHRR
ncbi:DUF6214 family protein [Streptomyces sp. NPDC126933]|uniref:DUF6214 family protein n=1 Tax=unclassified Streptomyces TaxID=2593676 RepID=UPI003664CF1E